MNADQPGPADSDPGSDSTGRQGRENDITVHCAMCGTPGEGPPLTWMLDIDPRRGAVHYCDGCARRHLRAIEGKLQQEWW